MRYSCLRSGQERESYGAPASFCLLVSPTPVAAISAVRPGCGIPPRRGRVRLETAPTPYDSKWSRDRVLKPRPRRPIGSSPGKPPSRWSSRSDGPACRSHVSMSRPYRRRSRSGADTRQRGSRGDASRRTTRNSSVASRRRGVCDGTATERVTARFAPPAAASWHAASRAARWPPTVKLVDVVNDRDGERVPCQDRLQGRATQTDDSGETAVARRGRIHHRRAALRQTQDAQSVDGAGAPPGREFADAVAGDHGARRPRRAERCPRREGLGAAQDLAGAVGEQVCRSGFPHESTRILSRARRPRRRRRARPPGSSRRGRTWRDADLPCPEQSIATRSDITTPP